MDILYICTYNIFRMNLLIKKKQLAINRIYNFQLEVVVLKNRSKCTVLHLTKTNSIIWLSQRTYTKNLGHWHKPETLETITQINTNICTSGIDTVILILKSGKKINDFLEKTSSFIKRAVS